jgi:hypothetical protein
MGFAKTLLDTPPSGTKRWRFWVPELMGHATVEFYLDKPGVWQDDRRSAIINMGPLRGPFESFGVFDYSQRCRPRFDRFMVNPDGIIIWYKHLFGRRFAWYKKNWEHVRPTVGKRIPLGRAPLEVEAFTKLTAWWLPQGFNKVGLKPYHRRYFPGLKKRPTVAGPLDLTEGDVDNPIWVPDDSQLSGGHLLD